MPNDSTAAAHTPDEGRGGGEGMTELTALIEWCNGEAVRENARAESEHAKGGDAFAHDAVRRYDRRARIFKRIAARLSSPSSGHAPEGMQAFVSRVTEAGSEDDPSVHGVAPSPVVVTDEEDAAFNDAYTALRDANCEEEADRWVDALHRVITRLAAPSSGHRAGEGEADTARLDWLEHNERMVEFTGDEPDAWRVRVRYNPHGYYDYVYGATARAAIDAARRATETPEGEQT